MCRICKGNHPSNYKKEEKLMETSKYVRKPFYVNAVRVDYDSMGDIANWCNGYINLGEDETERHIKVRVHRPMNERQTQAFVGDWVLKSESSFKVYTDKAFKNQFVPVEEVDTSEPVS